MKRDPRTIVLTVSLTIFAVPLIVSAQTPLTVFKGRPEMKITEAGVARLPENVPRANAVNLECVISQIGDAYYWATRENKPLVRIEALAYTTFVAVDGAGYIRIVKPERKSMAALADEAAERYDYVEHLVLGLSSVTYYGTATR